MNVRRVAVAACAAAATGLLVSIVALWPHAIQSPAAREAGGGEAGVPAGESPSLTGSDRVGRPSPPTHADPQDGPQHQGGRPVRVAVPAIGLDAAVEPAGVAADGQIRLPADPAVLGWYRFGPAPGAPGGGSVVLAGHLDSRRYGVGPLVRLRDTRLGDRVVVVGVRGARSTYVVSEVRRYDRQRLPDELFARDGAERLRLITCGGSFDADNGGYQQNLVVTAHPE